MHTQNGDLVKLIYFLKRRKQAKRKQQIVIKEELNHSFKGMNHEPYSLPYYG
jgi:hypothetical protein